MRHRLRSPSVRRGCSPAQSLAKEDDGALGKLSKQILHFLRAEGITRTEGELKEFACYLRCAIAQDEKKISLLRSAQNQPDTDVLYWIARARKHHNLDEILWRCFLAGHFGRLSANDKVRDEIESAGRFLCAFGSKPFWTWEVVSANLDALRDWLKEHRENLKSLRFGNHRKFESKKASSIFQTVESFVEWVRDSGGSPKKTFQIHRSSVPEASFNELFERLKENVWRFGRTASFDTLCLIGNLSILPIRADSCHLRGATGPLKGARKLFGKRRVSELTRLADDLARCLGAQFEVFEDALCGWQK